MAMRSIGVGLLLLISGWLAAPATAETIQLRADLKASNEVPPGDGAGKGSLTATYDTASKRLSWKGTYRDLTGPVIAAHFHGPATAAQNAGVVVPIPNPKPSFEGSATLTDAQAADLMAGRWYANFHTDANKGGEIRGQVVK